jgi:hypothetical protein
VFYEAQLREQVAMQLEGWYVQQGAFSPDDGRTMRLNYLQLPILVKVRLSGDTSRTLVPYVFGGPAIGLDTRGSKGVPKGDLSFMLGGGVRVKTGGVSILLDGSYGLGLTAVSPPPIREPDEFERLHNTDLLFQGRQFKNRLLSFSVGLAIPMGRKVVGFDGPDGARRRSVPSGDIITRQEITATSLVTAYEVVQRLHPQWLRSRGLGEPIVYVNNSRRGDPEELRLIMAESIAEIVYFNGRDATFRFGSGHGSGVIQVSIGR